MPSIAVRRLRGRGGLLGFWRAVCFLALERGHGLLCYQDMRASCCAVAHKNLARDDGDWKYVFCLKICVLHLGLTMSHSYACAGCASALQAVVGSMDASATRYAARVSMQKGLQEIIVDLKGMVRIIVFVY